MNEPDVFDALRRLGIDADDPGIRSAVRVVRAQVELERDQRGAPAARRCIEAMQAALAYELRHPDIDDMSSFEDDYDQPE